MSAEPPAPSAVSRLSSLTIHSLAVVGLTGSVAVVALLILAFGAWSWRDQPAKVEAADTKQIFTIGSASAIAHTNLVSLDVFATQGDAGSYSGRGEDRRNIILLDTATGASRRLLPNNDRRILQTGFLPSEARGTQDMEVEASAPTPVADKAPQVPTGYYLLVARTEGNGDDLILGSIAGPDQKTVLTAIDGVDSHWMLDPSHLALIVREKRKLSYRVIDMASFKVTASHPIAID